MFFAWLNNKVIIRYYKINSDKFTYENYKVRSIGYVE